MCLFSRGQSKPCPLKDLNSPGGFQEVNYSCENPKCQDNPYCEEPTPPTPSPVAGPTSPACTMTGLSGTSPVTVAASETLCLTAPGSWAGSNLVVNGNLVVCGNGDFTFTGSGIVNGAYYRTSTTEVKVNGAGIFVNGGTTSIADSNC